MPREADPIAVVEASYQLDLSDRAWLAAIAQAMAPELDCGLGTSASLWQRSPESTSLSAVCEVSTSAPLERLSARVYAAIPPELAPRWYTHVPSVTLASAEGKAAEVLVRQLAVDLGRDVRDVVGLIVGDGRCRGMTITALASRRQRVAGARRARWMRLASHLGAALRLRSSLRGAPDAILDSSGHTLHASEAAQSPAVRASLADAVRDMERARGGLRRRSPDEALAMWRALVDGRWSVVEWVDVDGRRLLVAHDNGVTASSPRALSGRERDVAEYLAHGRSNSEIAYALGLATGTVSRLARIVMRKLACVRRADLANVFGSGGLEAAPLREDVMVVSRAGSSALWGELSEAEREVVRLALGGASNREIAARRGRSERTIANQLAATYSHFGVSGRSELAALLGPAPSE